MAYFKQKEIAMFICPRKPVFTTFLQVETLRRENRSYMLLAQGNYLMHVLYDHNVGYYVIGNALLSPESTLLSFVSSQMRCYQLNPSLSITKAIKHVCCLQFKVFQTAITTRIK